MDTQTLATMLMSQMTAIRKDMGKNFELQGQLFKSEINTLSVQFKNVEERVSSLEGSVKEIEKKNMTALESARTELEEQDNKIASMIKEELGTLAIRVKALEDMPAKQALENQNKIKNTFTDTFLKLAIGGGLSAVGIWALSQIRGGP